MKSFLTFTPIHTTYIDPVNKIITKTSQYRFLYIYSSKEVLHHLDFFHILSDILTNNFKPSFFEFAQSERV